MSNKSLREIAHRLQDFPKYDKITGLVVTRQKIWRGDFCIKKLGVQAKDTDGKKYDPDILYMFDEIVYVDHFKELKKVYEKWGNDGVLKYVDIVNGYNPQTGEIALPKEEYEQVLGKVEIVKKEKKAEITMDPIDDSKSIAGVEMKLIPDETDGDRNKEEGVLSLQSGSDGNDAA